MTNRIQLLIILLFSAVSLYTVSCNGPGLTPAFTVTYDGNGYTSGSVPVDSKAYETDEAATVSGNIGYLSRTGFYFLGWNTKADGTGKNYTEGETFTLRTVSVTLYARWSSSSYPVFSTGPGGGIIFYDDESDGIDNISGFRYLEAATTLTEASRVWGGDGNLIGVSDTAIGTGKHNTAVIAEWLKSNNESGCAAQLCDTLDTGGYTDWYLPSKDELNLMYMVLRSYASFNSYNGEYWSSTEEGLTRSWSQNYYSGSGVQSSSNKTESFRVRAIRVF